uniref:Orotidine 5'-phosphate decarboxylase n=1 Tax=Candidatus Kentrum sp. SD TaxID=2126332 RepID=A0A450YK89_9GAMM|nr:MAG: orotidine-5'-phosphate decarboxylase [Candidatus Kentron sp. SD]VFK41955.1 MAG: orotidine-5'-phosphate decarboxylase [Candidatus Kentron sp. SD]VFK78885.1 MAG: orotidine-5'-phosphate decarboxylase [Candidatus Kentron sp. SD]
MNFADRLLTKTAETSPIVVGIDPNFSLMPKIFLPSSSDPGDARDALFDFSRAVIDSVHGLVATVKLQSAYYEQCGSLGIAALARSMAYAREKGLLVILDVKRGDIGATSNAYASAYLAGHTKLPGGLRLTSDLEADAITVNPFLGEDTLQSFVDLAMEHEKGIFILVKTSNPGSGMLQDKVIDGASLSERLAEMVHRLGLKGGIGTMGYSSVGAVVGATYPAEAARLRAKMPRAIHLVPGIGAQGGDIETTKANFDANGRGAIIPISRAITYPSNRALSREEYGRTLGNTVEKYRRMLDILALGVGRADTGRVLT